jgi:hypothetical protein
MGFHMELQFFADPSILLRVFDARAPEGQRRKKNVRCAWLCNCVSHCYALQPRTPSALRLNRTSRLLQNPPHDVPLHQFARLVQVVVRDGVRVDAHAVVDRGQEVARVDRVVQGG